MLFAGVIGEPMVRTHSRKILRPNPLDECELRVADFRVFYDVHPAATCVIVKAVGKKEHNQLFIRGREFIL